MKPLLVKLLFCQKTILHIESWYNQHPVAELKRKLREQETIINLLYKLCARYKKFLHQVINIESGGLIKSSFAFDESLPSCCSQQNNNLFAALRSYQTILRLQHSLKGDIPFDQKIQAFHQVFRQSNVQETLKKQDCSLACHALKELGDLLALGLISLFTQSNCPSKTLSTPLQDELKKAAYLALV